MNGSRNLTVAIRVTNPQVRQHLERVLDQVRGAGGWGSRFSGYVTDCVHLEKESETYDWFSNTIDERPENCAILLSDDLVEPFSADGTFTYLPKNYLKDILGNVQGNYVTLALMNEPRRVTDIDRVAAANCDAAELSRVLELCARKLAYLAPPSASGNHHRPLIEVRPIRSKTELCEYFKLRHDVYSVMGYLAPEVEDCASKLEINWNDRQAIHLGAFLKQPGNRETLVGTARLAITELDTEHPYQATLGNFENWTLQLAADDPVNLSALSEPLQLELPIFHSVPGLVSAEMYTNVVCGELSRVIVNADYRGAGISGHLVRQALEVAERVGVQRLFLECLPQHAALYERFGFQRLERPAAPVIGVKRTMVPMERVIVGGAAGTNARGGHTS
ncbi:MAG: GNAT family N-acetyltransferase [Pirellulaceae bacterium]|nr:GNAT family N-acetyltransferase [Pirellulaceae bacterium]